MTNKERALRTEAAAWSKHETVGLLKPLLEPSPVLSCTAPDDVDLVLVQRAAEAGRAPMHIHQSLELGSPEESLEQREGGGAIAVRGQGSAAMRIH